MKQLQLDAAIAIAAAPELVFFVLTDFDNYPSWNPFQLSIVGGPAADGQVLEVEIRLDDPEAPSTGAQRIEELRPPYVMRWRDGGKFSALTDITRDFLLERTPDGGTRFSTRLLFRGPLSVIASARFHNVLQQGMLDECAALCQQCEGVAQHL